MKVKELKEILSYCDDEFEMEITNGWCLHTIDQSGGTLLLDERGVESDISIYIRLGLDFNLVLWGSHEESND